MYKLEFEKGVMARKRCRKTNSKEIEKKETDQYVITKKEDNESGLNRGKPNLCQRVALSWAGEKGRRRSQ